MGKMKERMTLEELHESQIQRKKCKTTEKSRDYFNYFPGTKRVIPFVNEEEYREVCEAHKE